MNKRKKSFRCINLIIIIFGLICFLKINLNAQSKFVDILPSMPSPTVASLAKNCEFPEIDQNGIVPVEIPIWNLSFKGIDIPVSLKYNLSGIRVGQESSWVGLGWDLSALCFITRSVRDVPDDVFKERIVTEGSYDYRYKGWLYDPDRYQNFEANVTDKSSFLCLNDYGVSMDRSDSEPDVFFLNIGNTVKERFMFDHFGNIVFINPSQRFIVSKTIENESNGISEFCVTDGNGNKYFFGCSVSPNNFCEKTTISTKYLGSSYLDFNGQTLSWFFEEGGKEYLKYRTTWFLKKIVLANELGEINFNYESTTEHFDVMLDDHYTKGSGTSSSSLKPAIQGRWSGVQFVKHAAETKYLKEVTYPFGTIIFSLSSRNDINGGRKLDRIIIKNQRNEVIKECELQYFYQKADETGDDFDLTRLFLNKIIVSDCRNYELGYNITKLPSKKSIKQDFWGYYCSKSTSLIPKIWIYPDRNDYFRYSCYPISNQPNQIILDGSDRTMDEASVLAGSLRSIKLPTGGYQEYILESNDFYNDLWGEQKGGGLRIKEINFLNKDRVVILNRKFDYKNNSFSSGILINGLFFATPVGYTFKNSSYLLYDSGLTDAWDYFTLRRGNNYFPLYSHDGAQVSYTKVKIIEKDNGRIEKEYFLPKNYISNATKVQWANSLILCDLLYIPSPSYLFSTYKYIDLRNYKLSEASVRVNVEVLEEVGINWNCYGISDNSFYFNYNNSKIKLQSYDEPNNQNLSIPHSDDFLAIGKVQKNGFNIFPFPPISDNDEFKEGKLKVESFFKEGILNPIKKIEYDYTRIGDIANINGVSYSTSLVCNAFLTPLPLENDWKVNYGNNGQAFIQQNIRLYVLPKNWAMYTIKANTSTLMSKKIITEYFENGNELKVVENYDYNSNNLIIKEERIDEDGNVIKKVNRYLSDVFSYKGQPYNYVYRAFMIMESKNMTNNIIESITYKNNRVIESSVNSFMTFPESSLKVFPYSNFSFESEIPRNDTSYILSKVDNPSAPILIDPNLKPKLFFDEFDLNGNIKQYHLLNDVNNSFVWGYKGQYPIAKAINAKCKEIFYSSFEDEPVIINWGCPYTFDYTKSKSGKVSLKTYRPESSEYYYFMPFLDINNSQPKKYKYSGWVYSNGPSADIFLFYKPNSDDEQYSTGWQAVSVRTYETEKWVYLEGEVIVPSNMKRIYLRVDNNGGGTVWFDDLKLYPADAQMTTYTYDPLIGITTITSPDNKTTTYEYDNFGRLKQIKDHNGYILEYYDYNYKE